MGFTFDDHDKKGAASTLDEMDQLVRRNPSNQERIFPYIGGKEVNTDPRHAHHRFVIDLSDMSLESARQWPDLVRIVEERVKPQRDKMGGYSVAERRREYWWQYGTATPALNEAKRGLDRVLVVARVGQHASIAFLDAATVFSEQLLVFPFSSFAAFCSLQSRPHEMWARFFGSSMKDDLRYTPADCFENYPFSPKWYADPSLDSAGRAYYTFRADLMVGNDEGLTKTYNRFHDPDERSPDIIRLRELHAVMDRAVLDAYGWTDVPTDCDFFLDYEIDEETWGKKKKPWRYRWPDEVHDEVLARLLDLNQRRYQEEVAAGLHDKGKKKPTARRKPKPKKTRRRAKPTSSGPSLFDWKGGGNG